MQQRDVRDGGAVTCDQGGGDGAYLASVQDLLDREAIRDCMYRYCHAVDRLDRETLRGTYWPDASDDHTVFSGNAYEFIDVILPVLARSKARFHSVSNMLIRVLGDRAHVESYFHVLQRDVDDYGADYDYEVGGRYVDVFERRGAEWRVLRRLIVRDWYQVTYGTGDWEAYPRAAEGPHGSAKDTDPVRSIFGRLSGARPAPGGDGPAHAGSRVQ